MRVTDETRALMDDMLATMYDAPGIGLAAIQIGVPQRIVVADLAREDEERKPLYLVNPEIIQASEDVVRLRGRLPLHSGILRHGVAAQSGHGALSRPPRRAA